jgi:hypothetical protein
MCPNCVLNQSGVWSYLGPGLICLFFMAIAGYFIYYAKKAGEFEGDEEDPKYAVFDDN